MHRFQADFLEMFFRICLGVMCIFIVTTATANEYQRYKDKDLDVSFVYPSSWKVANPAEEATKFVVRWETQKTNSLVATCYLQATSNASADTYSEDFSRYYEIVRDDFTQATRDRTDKLEVISDTLSRVDGKDVMLTTLDVEIQNLNTKTSMRIFTVLTFWNGHQINLECGSALFDIDLTGYSESQKTQIKEFQGYMEKQIMHVLSSLHFDRSGNTTK